MAGRRSGLLLSLVWVVLMCGASSAHLLNDLAKIESINRHLSDEYNQDPHLEYMDNLFNKHYTHKPRFYQSKFEAVDELNPESRHVNNKYLK